MQNYDRRHGWRGPITNLPVDEHIIDTLKKLTLPNGADEEWVAAVVTELSEKEAKIITVNEDKGTIPH